MKAGWTSKPLEDACTFINGLWKGDKDPLKTVGVIRNTNFTKDGALDDTDIAFIEVEVKKFDKRKLFAGDIILEKSGGGPKQAVGRVVLFDKPEGDYSFSNFTAAIRVKSPDELDAKYLHKFLHWTYLSGVTEGMQSNSTGIRNLDGDKYKAIQVSYPSIGNQRRIVTLLDEAFADIATAKANAEKNLQNAGALFQSQLTTLFNRRAKRATHTTLGQATGGIFTGPFGSLLHKQDYIENGIPLVNPAHISQNGIEPDDRKTVSGETAKRLANYIMRTGDIVIGRRGEMGRCALVTDAEDGWLCGTGSFFIKPSSRCDAGYLVHLLRSDQCKQQLENIAGGAVMPNLSNTDLSNFALELPPVEDQKQIVAEIEEAKESVERLKSIYRQKLTALDDLKKSLLHQAFSGQLTQ
ncbi:MAG: restriction endonuclease subunit S [Comamonadaceae bacterium PBBC1]|nr:MAG: restriction endonuclease subunit S [Comamonadaceae bacterium PBBC1]